METMNQGTAVASGEKTLRSRVENLRFGVLNLCCSVGLS